MRAFVPDNWNQLLIIADAGYKYDRDLMEAEGGTHVLSKWSFGRSALGVDNWNKTARASLYDYSEDTAALTPAQKELVKVAKRPKAAEKAFVADNRAARREEMSEFILHLKPKLTIVLASRATEVKTKDEDESTLRNHSGTDCWGIFGAPTGLAEMAGTIFISGLGPVMGILNPANHEFVWGWCIRNALVGGLSYARGETKIFAPKEAMTAHMPGPKMRLLLRQIKALHIKGSILSVDLETVPTEDLITCIGLACGPYAVSVPWDSFPVAGGKRFELAGSLELHRDVMEILAIPAPKVGHNILGYDVPYMARRGIPMAGPVEDTMAVAGVLYKQFQKGLQHCVAREFLIGPWKSMHAAPGYHKASKEAWTANPMHLRRYNVLDAWYTLRLWEATARKAGLL